MKSNKYLSVSLLVVAGMLLAACGATPEPETNVQADKVEAVAPAGAAKYHFVMVSHIGSSDPNMLWLTFAIDEFQRRFPEVTVDLSRPTNSASRTWFH